MQYAVEILQREHLNVRYNIRRLRQLSDEVQCDLVKDLPLREAELQKAIAHLQSAEQGESPATDRQPLKAAIVLLNRWMDDPDQDLLLGETNRFVRNNASAPVALPVANVAQRDTATNKSQPESFTPWLEYNGY